MRIHGRTDGAFPESLQSAKKLLRQRSHDENPRTESYRDRLQIRDFFRLAPIHRKTKVKIHILEKHGLPFFFYRSKKRKAFFLGLLLLCIGLLLFLSGRYLGILM